MNDCEPGGVLGGARLYPHVMVMSNVTGERVEATIDIQRPATAMSHGDPEMSPEIRPLFVTDTNEPKVLPAVHWDNIFDYYTTRPYEDFGARSGGRHGSERREAGEVCFADPSAQERTTAGAVEVLNSMFTPAYEPRVIKKQARQGEFDNIHLAPRMQLEVSASYGSEPPVLLEDIAMAPFCVHDCLHTHLRWGRAGGDPPKAMLGFDNHGTPHAKDGAPHVPPNQHVFVRLTSQRSFRYRAVATGPIRAGVWTCFMHHGLFYAVDLWPGFGPYRDEFLAGTAVQGHANLRKEPYMRGTNFPSALYSWAALYWRLRWGGRAISDTEQAIFERLNVLSLERCMQ